MCVGFWSLEHPEYALYVARAPSLVPIPFCLRLTGHTARILCSNKDEYLSRPTAPAHFHAFEVPVDAGAPERRPRGSVLSGRDLRGGGTWLGISRSGHVAFL